MRAIHLMGSSRNFGVASILRKQPFSDHMGDQMRAVPRSGLEPNVFNVPFDGARCNGKFQGRFLGGKAESNETKHLILAICKSNILCISRHVVPPLAINE